MKKKLLTFVLVLSSLFIGLDIVNADTLNYDYYEPPYITSQFNESQFNSILEDAYTELYQIWSNTYSTTYPYYYFGVAYLSQTNVNSVNEIRVFLRFTSDYSNFDPFSSGTLSNSSWGFLYMSAWCNSNSSCPFSTPQQIAPNSQNATVNPSIFSSNTNNGVTERMFWAYTYWKSNFDYYFPNDGNTYNVVKDGNLIESFSNGDLLPTYSESNFLPTTYTTINLNDYSYVVLSLKNYNLLNDEINQYYSNFIVTGQLCMTTVYNYGMKEKQDVISDYQTQSCTESYTSPTPVRVYILKQDLQNKAVYYLKSYNYAIDNIIQVDTAIYDITYISSANENSPQVTINGRSYPVIPYSQLTDTATSSTDEGYVSGRVCAIGDVNCQGYEMGMDIADLFTHPLTLLQSIWTSIIGVFTIITTFMAVLPPTLQAFMYTSFMLGIVLGIIKIIL